MAVLVTGGAGYIGSHAVWRLLERGEEVIVLDSLRTGHRKAILTDRAFIGDLRDEAFLDHVFRENRVESVIHFAASSQVGESMEKPLEYYDNNVVSSLNLVRKMAEYGVRRLVFSSTAAVYGEPVRVPIEETDPVRPVNPYGETKLAVERLLEWARQAYGLEYAVLRYFNVAGAHPGGHIGEDHDPETHLIPLVLRVALGKRDHVKVYGDDYPTPDGTCIRDYIHVMDLAEAHLLALDRLRQSGGSMVFNLGNGRGFSVREVIETARRVTGHPLPVRTAARRPGDPAILTASSRRAVETLGWKPRYADLETIVRTAWEWHRTHPDGYGSRRD